MANKRKRPQTQKPAALRTRDKDTLAMLLRNGDGPHRNRKTYDRKVKHKGRIEY